ncbi:MAG: type II toxin-antitoxin system VapB family antitoxin [Gammaproteobacteria bacterium]|nr:type II toxin-antitoxin system VapB family antitoxin [Gammaproteobacteria bacterium]
MTEKAFASVAKLFMNGRSQAVRLPAECRFDADEVMIRKLGDNVIISPRTNCWDDFFARQPLPVNERIPDIEELDYEKREFFN